MARNSEDSMAVGLREYLDAKFDAVDAKIDGLESKFDAMDDRMTNIEMTMASLNETHMKSSETIYTMSGQMDVIGPLLIGIMTVVVGNIILIWRKSKMN